MDAHYTQSLPFVITYGEHSMRKECAGVRSNNEAFCDETAQGLLNRYAGRKVLYIDGVFSGYSKELTHNEAHTHARVMEEIARRRFPNTSIDMYLVEKKSAPAAPRAEKALQELPQHTATPQRKKHPHTKSAAAASKSKPAAVEYDSPIEAYNPVIDPNNLPASDAILPREE